MWGPALLFWYSVTQIEKANSAELDWALANMKAVRSKKRDTITDKLVTDADGKAAKEDVCRSLSDLDVVTDDVVG